MTSGPDPAAGTRVPDVGRTADPADAPTESGPGVPGRGSGEGVASLVASASSSSAGGVARTVSAESLDATGVGVRTLAATAGTFELDRAPHTGQRPPSAGAELPHWGQVMMDCSDRGPDYRLNR